MRMEPLSADQLEAIHQASLRIISEHGIRVLSETARDALRQQGCMVDDAEEMVRMDPALLKRWLQRRRPASP